MQQCAGKVVAGEVAHTSGFHKKTETSWNDIESDNKSPDTKKGRAAQNAESEGFKVVYSLTNFLMLPKNALGIHL